MRFRLKLSVHGITFFKHNIWLTLLVLFFRQHHANHQRQITETLERKHASPRWRCSIGRIPKGSFQEDFLAQFWDFLILTGGWRVLVLWSNSVLSCDADYQQVPGNNVVFWRILIDVSHSLPKLVRLLYCSNRFLSLYFVNKELWRCVKKLFSLLFFYSYVKIETPLTLDEVKIVLFRENMKSWRRWLEICSLPIGFWKARIS